MIAPLILNPYNMGTKKTGPSRTTAALISLLAGGIGGEWFYLGKEGYGLISMVMFWSGIPLFIGIVHFFQFLLISDEDFDKYVAALSPEKKVKTTDSFALCAKCKKEIQE